MTVSSSPADTVLVAHRGDAAHYPENTLAAFAGAARLGLRFVELDVQVTADGVPIVLHDESLARTHGLDVHVTKVALRELDALGVLTGGNHAPPVPRLAEFVAWLRKEPQILVFVEIKKESLRAHGRARVLEVTTRVLETVRERTMLISYDARVLAMARHEDWPIGYVLEQMNPRYRRIAERLAPEYLFADHRHIRRTGGLWPGEWQWAAFELEKPAEAAPLAALGVRYLETMDPASFLGVVKP